MRKGKLGGGHFGWIPRGMGSFKGKPVCENTSEKNAVIDKLQESDVQEVAEEKDLFDELIEAMNV